MRPREAVVVGYDGSAMARSALGLAGVLRRRWSAEADVVTVHTPAVVGGRPWMGMSPGRLA